MEKITWRSLFKTGVVLLTVFTLAACNAFPSFLEALPFVKSSEPSPNLQEATPVAQKNIPTPTAVAPGASGVLAAYEGTLEQVYQKVNPSVVSIRVVSQVSAVPQSFPDFPFFFDPFGNLPDTPQIQEGQGSGFVWDKEGHIVTNNHVVEGADKIEVTFSDGYVVPAELIGTDPYTDLAVIKVDVSADRLVPVTLADSSQVQVGQLAIAIGNPFGLSNTMTVGIVSATGRTLPAGETRYSIPEVIQTDAPINPGNSGGVLVDAQGNVMGVTAAIESTTRSNAGIGFVIPSIIVRKVVPSLIANGKYEHAWLGITGTSLTPAVAKAMKLDEEQRGALIIEVAKDSPADKAGLRGSTEEVKLDGSTAMVGGDVIVAINGEPTQTIEDVIAYLATKTNVGDQVNITILRDGKEKTVSVTLEARPSSKQTASATSGQVYLGISGVVLDEALVEGLNLPKDTTGILIQRVQADSPADKAGLRGGTRPVSINGRMVLAGGDVILAIDDQAITSLKDLQDVLAQHSPGDVVNVTILRNGRERTVEVTLEARP
ncbi:PDZ domain-containing protein [Anaerolinea thermophila]|uniref:S1B family peptidase n=1 Tax=Anaerolinea thermophila (strain DSM 14523 / JCM 11388 / NBRC 100420 / UNI-1) TaxID=926569 RepID=E8N3F4_ANATU|nr:trypsin-like peptidase domain-containing protein [Anaerolinea thermophila]BAJ62968.1 putative S1B family peptidase [Anaerolinea thermophila UNI-1]